MSVTASATFVAVQPKSGLAFLIGIAHPNMRTSRSRGQHNNSQDPSHRQQRNRWKWHQLSLKTGRNSGTLPNWNNSQDPVTNRQQRKPAQHSLIWLNVTPAEFKNPLTLALYNKICNETTKWLPHLATLRPRLQNSSHTVSSNNKRKFTQCSKMGFKTQNHYMLGKRTSLLFSS